MAITYTRMFPGQTRNSLLGLPWVHCDFPGSTCKHQLGCELSALLKDSHEVHACKTTNACNTAPVGTRRADKRGVRRKRVEQPCGAALLRANDEEHPHIHRHGSLGRVAAAWQRRLGAGGARDEAAVQQVWRCGHLERKRLHAQP